MVWDKPRILKELKRLERAGAELSYNALARKRQALLSAAAYHFGSYRKAVERAGINYGDVTRRPRWTKPRIIALIKKAKRAGHDLHWSAVTKRRDELGRAAFASLQPRLFGRWDRALHAARVDPDEVRRRRRWTKPQVLAALRAASRGGSHLSDSSVRREQPALYGAAVRLFGAFTTARKAAKVKYAGRKRG